MSFLPSGYFIGTSAFTGTTVVASHNTLLLWVRNLRETASAAKANPTEIQPALRTPKNVKRLRQTFVGSLRRSESRNALALRTSGRTVR
jgi:hypothetical protein